MLVGAEAGAIGVVIELDEFLAPPEKHGVPGGKHGVDSDEQRFGPLVDGADRGLAPVEGASEIGHLAGAEDAILPVRGGSGGLLSVILLVFYGHERLVQHWLSAPGIACVHLRHQWHQRQFLMSLVCGMG